MTHFSDGVRAGRNFNNNGTASLPGVFMSPINVDDIVPDALVTNGICTQQTITGAANAVINGSLASGGVATLDVPRNVIVARRWCSHCCSDGLRHGTPDWAFDV